MRSTIVPRFVDTNVLLYAVSGDPAESGKKAAALRLLRDDDLALSTQVLAEFSVQATRASRSAPLSRADATGFIETLLLFPVQAVTIEVFRAALAAQERHGLSFWDAQIISAARAAGCHQVLTEDLNAGQDYDGVVAVNPFAA